jgi:hypothetical protein
MDATELDGSTGLRTGDASHGRLVIARAIRLLLRGASPAEDDGPARAAVALRPVSGHDDHGQAEAVGWMAGEAESNQIIVVTTVDGLRV